MVIRRRFSRILAAPHVRAVRDHVKHLQTVQALYNVFPDVVFIFQFFNKKRNCFPVLSPFIENHCQNIIVFADGCIDSTSQVAHNLLPGASHFVISANDRHEIANYRLGLHMAKSLGCQYAVLLQDDDIYENTLFTWISSSLQFMKSDNISIVGGCSGCDLDPDFTYNQADAAYCTTRFTIDQTATPPCWSLGSYQRMIVSQPVNPTFGLPRVYAATVSRAPQIIDVDVALQLGFFPSFLEPYQYDDDYNAFRSWLSGYKVLFCPVSGKRTVGLSGMRLYNNISETSRPDHVASNWNEILEHFSHAIHAGTISRLVNEANASMTNS
ncbi:MAG: hypothetical protein ACK587_13995 [Cyanobacteriota bacterium]